MFKKTRNLSLFESGFARVVYLFLFFIIIYKRIDYLRVELIIENNDRVAIIICNAHAEHICMYIRGKCFATNK